MDFEIDFEAWFDNAGFTKSGDLKLILVVPKRCKPEAIRVTDLTGVRFNVHVEAIQRPAIDVVSARPTVSQLKAQKAGPITGGSNG